MTIGDVLSGWRGLYDLSAGEFDEKYLAGYSDVAPLLECCRAALAELADEPYLGRVSNARVMARAMELLRRDFGVNAPRGWYPVIKRLRNAA